MDDGEGATDEVQVPINNELEQKIADAFLVFDKTRKKCIDAENLPFVIHALGCVPTQEEMGELVASLEEKDPPGIVNLAKFIPKMVAIFNGHKYQPLDVESLLTIFRKYDPENHGYIDKNLFATMLTEYGEPFDEEELAEFMALAVDPRTQNITYEYYLNQISYQPEEENDLYKIADKIEAAKPKIIKKTMSQMMRELDG